MDDAIDGYIYIYEKGVEWGGNDTMSCFDKS